MAAEDEEQFGESQFKILLVGDGSSGKTSISLRFVQDHFGKDYQQTIGLDFFSKRMDLPDGSVATVSVWDIGGQSIGSQMLDKYFHGASAIMFVYDITNTNSFENLQDWYDIVIKHYNGKPRPLLALVGNKCDLAHMRSVKPSAHEDFAKHCRMGSFFVSAKTGDQVVVCFKRILSQLTGQVLTKADMDLSSPIVRASIPEPEAGSKPVPPVTAKPTSQKKSNVCLLQ